ncbi:hypothetical protein GCM10017624_34380 [Azotobacter vinelandii]|nr:hypothetical protein GCM10017624_34380 [Azotobacter vinelandii]
MICIVIDDLSCVKPDFEADRTALSVSLALTAGEREEGEEGAGRTGAGAGGRADGAVRWVDQGLSWGNSTLATSEKVLAKCTVRPSLR